MKKLILLYAALLMLSGCGGSEQTDSTSVTNEGLWAGIRIEQVDNGQANIVVEVNVGGQNGTNVVLSNGEMLEAIANGIVRNLEEDTDFLDVDYQGSIPVSGQATVFTINFYRNNQPNILNSVVTLADGFVLTSPQAGDTLFSNQVAKITWLGEESDRTVNISIRLQCKNMAGHDLFIGRSFFATDDGEAEFDIGTEIVDQSEDIDRNQDCTASVTVERRRTGTLAPGFAEGGFITATRVREVSGLSFVIVN